MKSTPVSRRDFISSAAVAGAGLALGGLVSRPEAAPEIRNALELPPLPWAKNALEPYLSARTIDFHYGQHHKGYVDTVNFMLQKNPQSGFTLEKVINEYDGAKDKYGLFLNAVLAWNHAFLWQSMKAGGGGKPSGVVLQEIEKSYGTYVKFREEFFSVATQQIYGWAWLVKQDGKLKAIRTNYGEYPPLKQLRPLACLDLWEHAYYLDYQNRFGDYVNAYLDHLINWNFVALNFTNKYME